MSPVGITINHSGDLDDFLDEILLRAVDSAGILVFVKLDAEKFRTSLTR